MWHVMEVRRISASVSMALSTTVTILRMQESSVEVHVYYNLIKVYILLDINYNNRSFLLCIIISAYENVSTYRLTGPIIYNYAVRR